MKKLMPLIIVAGYLLAGTAVAAGYGRGHCKGLENYSERGCLADGALAGVFWWLYVPYKVWSRVLP